MKKKVFRILQKSVRIACKRRFKGKVISYMLHYLGDMANEESIEASLLKSWRKGEIYPSGSGQPIARLGSRFLRERQEKIQDTLLQDQ